MKHTEQEGQVIEGAVVDGETGEVLSRGSVLELVQYGKSASDIVTPLTTALEAADMYRQYIELETAILEDTDYVYYVIVPGQNQKPSVTLWRADAEAYAKKVGGIVQRRKKKSAFRKMGTFFGLTIPNEAMRAPQIVSHPLGNDGYLIVEVGDGYVLKTYTAKDFSVIRAEVTAEVIAPNGKRMVGFGGCSINERSGGAKSFAHADHDVVATAFTRAINRAISDLIGWGEVSAEETGDDLLASEGVGGNGGSNAASGGSGFRPQAATVAAKQPATPATKPLSREDEVKTVPQLIAYASSVCKVSPPALLELAGAKSYADIKEEMIPDIIKKIKGGSTDGTETASANAGASSGA